jgi:hypothetical protein
MTDNTTRTALPRVSGGDGPALPALAVTRLVRLRGASRFPLHAWRQTGRLALVLALGLPAIMLAFHLLDPAAAPSYIVLPVLAGGLLPLLVPPAGRFEIATDGDPHSCAAALDDVLGALGYEREAIEPGVIRYRLRASRRARAVDVRVGQHRLAVIGPLAALQSLRQRLAC